MTIEDKIRDEKLQYGINREEAKMSSLSSGKTDKHKHLTCKEILPSDKRQRDKKAFENRRKKIEDSAEKQIKPLNK